jgi:hypothetical protein
MISADINGDPVGVTDEMLSSPPPGARELLDAAGCYDPLRGSGSTRRRHG